MSATQSLTATIATYTAVHAAIEQHRPLSIVYSTGGTLIRERTITPIRIAVGTRGSDLVMAEDSLRDGIVSFRIDRIVAISGAVEDRY